MNDNGGIVAKYFPIVGWLPKYPRRWLRLDFLAGVAVWALLLPEGMAYAELAGMPPEAALVTIPGALLAYAVFGTSRQAIVGPTSSIALLSAVVVGSLAGGGTEEFIALTAALAVLSGALFVLLGIVRWGFVSQFFSRSVMTGFLFGLAVVIVVWQLPKLLGLEVEGDSVLQILRDVVTHLGHTHLLTLFVGVSSLVLLIALERFAHRLVPAALVVLVYGILLVTVFGLHERGVHVVGEIATALPEFGLPAIDLADIVSLLPGAVAILLVAYAESIGAARDLASEEHYRIDPDQELIALGVSNLSSGLSGGFAVGTSLSKSMDNHHAGARSEMSAIVAAGLMIVSAVALTGLFHNIPEATLAAIVIFAVWKLMDVGELRRLFGLRRVDFWVALIALLGVVLLGVLQGLVLSVVIALLGFIYRASRPHFSVLGKVPGERVYGDIERHPGSQDVPGLLIVRPDAPMFFANASLLRDELRKLVQDCDPGPEAVILDLEASGDLDVPAADELAELVDELTALDIEVMLARVRAPVHDLLLQTGLVDEIGEDRFYPTVDEAVRVFRKEHPD
jgi:high affinity sulfate transporter 1